MTAAAEAATAHAHTPARTHMHAPTITDAHRRGHATPSVGLHLLRVRADLHIDPKRRASSHCALEDDMPHPSDGTINRGRRLFRPPGQRVGFS